MPLINPDNYLTTSEFAVATGLPLEAVKKHCVRANLKAFKWGNRWMIEKAEVEAFPQRKRERGRPVSDS